MIEFLNKIELVGIVGRCNSMKVGDQMYAQLSVATEFAYTDREGFPVIDTTWHNVVIWQSKTQVDLTSIKRGEAVHVVGRLRARRYVTSDGSERISYEVNANQLEKLEKGDEPVAPEK